MKSTLAGVLGFALFLSPVFAAADTMNDLQAQLRDVLSRIAALQSSSHPSSSATTTPQSYQNCWVPSRTLMYGSRGDDVTSLQQYLAQEGFYTGSTTGYFGAQTRDAVGRWQSHHGISMWGRLGFGMFGPQSRSWYTGNCKPGSQPQQPVSNPTFSADKISGPSPLTVSFTASDTIASTSTYSVDFGDGQSAQMSSGSCVGIAATFGGQGGIRCSYSASHTYTATGTYTAKLLKNTCPAGAQCFVGPQTVGTLTIVVNPTQTIPANVQRINAPTNVILATGGIAEIRNKSAYFTVTDISSATSTATIQVTPVGCWNSFPSDTPPQMHCMIAVMPIPPQTLSVGQSYASGAYTITLTGTATSTNATSTATFSVN